MFVCELETISVNVCVCMGEGKKYVVVCLSVCACIASARREPCRGDIKVNTACGMLCRLGRQQMALWQMESLSGTVSYTI